MSPVAVRRWLGGLLVASAVVSGVVFSVLRVAAGVRTVELTLTAGKEGDPTEFTFSGYGEGAMTLTVPVGTMVVVHFVNTGTIPHSLLVLPWTASQPPLPQETPAFPGASTTRPGVGLAPGHRETVSFEASRVGTYEFLCGIPGHALAGMWDRLVVSSDASAALIAPESAAKDVRLTVR